MESKSLIIIIFIAINLYSFIIMGMDKRKAIKQKTRFKESYLISLAITFGALGVFLGSVSFNHKKQKSKFKIIPIIMIIQLILIYLII